MEYKGYVATVEFDESAEILHGKVVNSGPYPSPPSRLRMRNGFAKSLNAQWTSIWLGVRRMALSLGSRIRAN